MNSHELEAYLLERGLAGEILRLPAHTLTVEAAAAVVGCPTDHIAKSVLFLVVKGEASPAPVLVVANGTARIDYKRVAQVLGVTRRQLRLAGAEAVLAHTGYAVGAVAPLGHPRPLRTLLDRRVLALPEVYAGGGDADALLRIDPRLLAEAVGAEVVDVVGPREAKSEGVNG